MRLPVKFNRYDALVVLLVVLLAAALFVRQLPREEANGALTLTVASDGAVLETALLSAMEGEHCYQSGGYTITLLVEDGCVRVMSSDCPNQDCVHTAAISRAGQSIVCLPARLSITLSGVNASYDLIAG